MSEMLKARGGFLRQGLFYFCLAGLLGDVGHVPSSRGTSLPSSKTGQGLPPAEKSGKILAQKSKAVRAGLSGGY